MKTRLFFLTLLVIVGLVSCKTDENVDKTVSYMNYLNDKSIIAIHIQDDVKYIFTSRLCDTCHVPPYMSYIPTIDEWTVVKKDSTYEKYSPGKFAGLPQPDHKGQLYRAKASTIYKLNDRGEYEPLLNTGDYIFQNFTFDKDDNIWLYGDNNGFAFWNKSELKIFNTQNSPLPTDRIHGLAADQSGTVWVSLDFKGIVKIEHGNWTIVPNSEIPGLSKYSYLQGPEIGIDNSVWFEVFSPDTTSNLVKFENGQWKYEFPDDINYSHLKIDSKGTVWAISNHFDAGAYMYSTLKYYKNNAWINFDLGNIDKQITTVDADDHRVYIGTIKGLIEKPK